MLWASSHRLRRVSLGVCTGWIFNALHDCDSSGAANGSNSGENSQTASSCRDVGTRSS